jgi:hypothetical protein
MSKAEAIVQYAQRHVQGVLFEVRGATTNGIQRNGGTQFNGKSVFSDPAFAQNKSVPIHRWVPWIAGFSQDFVQDALKRHLTNKGTVLDPFSGVGTTLVESILAGHSAVGFEINPYAALACKVKLGAHGVKAPALKDEIRRFRDFFQQATGANTQPKTVPPEGFRTRGEFYSPKVLTKVLLVQDFISGISDSRIRDLFRIAFASTMVTYSNYSYEPSLGRRASAGRDDIDDSPVGQVIEAKLSEMAQDILWTQERLRGRKPKFKIFNESFFNCRKNLKAASVDLLLTSPPYLNNYHYNRNTRPHLYWLGYAEKPSDLEPLERDNFGKYWQTVREEQCIKLNPKIANTEIIRTLERLRQKTPEKGIYGGNGWANYAASYFNDCYEFSKCARYVLRKGATALVVIGNSILQGVLMPTDRFLIEIAESVGLEAVEIHMPRATRVGNSIIQSDARVEKAQDSDSLYEAVVELRKRK